MTHRRDALASASLFAALPHRTETGILSGVRARTSRANSSLRSDFACGTIFTLPLRFDLDGLRSRSVPSRPKPCGETKKFFRAPAWCRALRSASQLLVLSVQRGTNAYSCIHLVFRACACTVRENAGSRSLMLSLRFAQSSATGKHLDLSSLLPAAVLLGAALSSCSPGGSALRSAGREATRTSRDLCIQRSGCGRLKKEIAASLILRFNKRCNSRIVRCDKVCVCRTAQPPAARPQTPLQGGSAPVDPRDDRSERTR